MIILLLDIKEKICGIIYLMILKDLILCHLLNMKYRNGLEQIISVSVASSAVWHACDVIIYIL